MDVPPVLWTTARRPTRGEGALGNWRRVLCGHGVRVHQNLAVSFRITQVRERRGDVFQPHLSGDQGGYVDLAFGDTPQGLAELVGRISLHELEGHLFRDAV